MCGIAGVVALRDRVPPPGMEGIQAMVRALRRRGPAEFGLYRDRRAGLGHVTGAIMHRTVVDRLAGPVRGKVAGGGTTEASPRP